MFMKSTITNKTIATTAVMCFLSFLVGFLMGYRILPECNDMTVAFWTFSIILFPVCLLFSMLTPHLEWLCLLLTLSAVAVGVGTDALTDTTIDRNLWGIEAIISTGLAATGVITGGITGVFLSYIIRKRRKKCRSYYFGQKNKDGQSARCTTTPELKR